MVKHAESSLNEVNCTKIDLMVRNTNDEFSALPVRRTLVILLNGSSIGADFYLPKGRWKLLVDGFHLAVNARGLPGNLDVRGDYHVHPGTGVVLECI